MRKLLLRAQGGVREPTEAASGKLCWDDPVNGIMTENNPQPTGEAYRFILENIDSVPHLEALMLLWNSRPRAWTTAELATRLYVPLDKVAAMLSDLERLGAIAESTGSATGYSYVSRSPEQDAMMRQVDEAYRRDLVRISTMIHAKAPSAVREFARAFRWKKEQDG